MAEDSDVFNPPPDDDPDATQTVKAGPVKGSDLRPDLTVVHGDDRVGPFWYGAMPDLPVGSVTIGGITFMQVVEDVTFDEQEQDTKRSPYIGVVGMLMDSQLRALAEELPRMVVRFHAAPPDAEDHGSVQNIGMAAKKDARRGFIIRIPTAEEERKLREAGRFKPYIPSRLDEPLADYLYLVKQEARGQNLPMSLGEAGLE